MKIECCPVSKKVYASLTPVSSLKKETSKLKSPESEQDWSAELLEKAEDELSVAAPDEFKEESEAKPKSMVSADSSELDELIRISTREEKERNYYVSKKSHYYCFPQRFFRGSFALSNCKINFAEQTD